VLSTDSVLRHGRRRSPAVPIAVALCLLADILYLLTVEADRLQSPRVWFVATYVGALALMGALGEIVTGVLRVVFLSAAAAGMLMLGVLAGLVVGSPLLLAGGLVVSALVRFARTPQMLPASIPLAVIGAMAAWFALAWGLAVFQL
jgi:hypothetical protein